MKATGPRKVFRKLSEKKIQATCAEYARKRGYWARKFSSPSQRSVPDFLFAKTIDHRRVKFAVEFKAPRKKSTDAQTEEQDNMVAAGWTVYRDVDDFERFKQIIFDYENFSWLN